MVQRSEYILSMLLFDLKQMFVSWTLVTTTVRSLPPPLLDYSAAWCFGLLQAASPVPATHHRLLSAIYLVVGL